MIKKTLITGAVTVILGVTGYMNAGQIKEAVQCVGKDVHLEYQDAYYCGSNQEFIDTYQSFRGLLETNKLHDEEGIVFGRLVVRNNIALRGAVKEILLAKYDPVKDEFDGAKYDSDLLTQFQILVDIADVECGGGCELVGDTMNQRIYNLIK